MSRCGARIPQCFTIAARKGSTTARTVVELGMAQLRIALIALCALPLGAAANAGTWAAMTMSDATPNDTGVTQDIAARKGTRNFRSDGGSATTTTPSTTDINPSAGTSPAEKIRQCMETWDTGTHISKSKWREICQRQLRAGE